MLAKKNQRQQLPALEPTPVHDLSAPTRPASDSAPRGPRLISPVDGDVYRIPPGVPAAFASIPLRASGLAGPLRWYVDGALHDGARWPLARGTHVIRVEAVSGTAIEARIVVE